MNIGNVMLFAYDFPHKKTQDFIFKLLVEGYKIQYVIAAPWKKLSIPPPSLRFSPIHAGLIHPKDICKRFDIKYLIFDHNSNDTISYLQKNPVDLYIISGARILSKKIIDIIPNKILNIHPGLLPQIRGVDTLLWTIYNNLPLGISAHLISSQIDAGTLIYKETLHIYNTDTLIDLSLRLLEKQPDVLIKSLKILRKKPVSSFINLQNMDSQYHKKMPYQLEKEIPNLLPQWINKYSS